MALVWIKHVVNNSEDKYLKLKQTDPSKNPVVHTATKFWRLDSNGLPKVGQEEILKTDLQIGKDEWFGLGPGGEIRCDWFVIPWSNTEGSVTAIASKDIRERPTSTDGLVFHVSPEGGGKRDYLRFYKRNLSPLGEPLLVGDAGPLNSTEGRLVLNDEGFYYQITASNSAGSDVGEFINTWGPVLLSALLQGKGGGSPPPVKSP